MDWDFITRAGQFVFTVVIGLYSLLAARRSASTAEAQALDKRLNNHHTRIVTVEQQLIHLPDAKQMSDLAGDMKAVKAELAGVARELAPLARALDRINDYLLRAQ
ncbi:DUF2730 family protein [Pseudomonas peli]|uniref:DUF2730 family protein n=1 Tax=Pseudomonas peli TaxID=592361 RepID=UPI002860BA4F|nr:DUF2730 family protein [Pseudomonas peli]MDR7024377.1 putative nucleic acid-binding Zn-ribbon protein [Pseudomonas peli]